jgi:hypothetical protein
VSYARTIKETQAKPASLTPPERLKSKIFTSANIAEFIYYKGQTEKMGGVVAKNGRTNETVQNFGRPKKF